MEMIKLLLTKMGSNVINRSPRIVSVLESYNLDDTRKLNLIELLLECGADPMIKSINLDSSLIAAIDNVRNKQIRYDICKTLIGKKPNVANLTGFRSRTPYMYADYKKDQNVMNLLKDNGVDTHIDSDEDMDWE